MTAITGIIKIITVRLVVVAHAVQLSFTMLRPEKHLLPVDGWQSTKLTFNKAVMESIFIQWNSKPNWNPTGCICTELWMQFQIPTTCLHTAKCCITIVLKQKNKLSEAQWQDKHHSPQGIRTPEKAQPSASSLSFLRTEPTQKQPATEPRMDGRKPQIS